MIKVLVADDQEMIRESLKIVLNSKEDFEVTDAVANGLEVIQSIRINRTLYLWISECPRLTGFSVLRW